MNVTPDNREALLLSLGLEPNAEELVPVEPEATEPEQQPVVAALDEAEPAKPAKPKRTKAEKAERKAAKAARKAAEAEPAAPVSEAKLRGKAKAKQRALAAPRFDERSLPASKIEFTLDMVDGFDLSLPHERREASRVLFDRFKSPFRDSDRHAVLHRRITEFIGEAKRATAPGYVAKQVRQSKPEREMAAVLAEYKVTPEQLASLLDRLL